MKITPLKLLEKPHGKLLVEFFLRLVLLDKHLIIGAQGKRIKCATRLQVTGCGLQLDLQLVTCNLLPCAPWSTTSFAP